MYLTDVCRYDEDQSAWKSVLEYNPDVWVWTGDASYNDDKPFPFYDIDATVSSMEDRYNKVKTSHWYSQLVKSTPITGVWVESYTYHSSDPERMTMITARMMEIADTNSKMIARGYFYNFWTKIPAVIDGSMMGSTPVLFWVLQGSK